MLFDLGNLRGLDVIDIGCGRKKIDGALGLDIVGHPGVDIVADLNEPLPLDDHSFDVVYSDQVFEHIEDFLNLMRECHRILRPDGTLIAHVPYFRSSWAAIDPTHIRMFSISSMNYFVEGCYENENYSFFDEKFSEITVLLDYNYKFTPLRWFFSKLALRWPHRYENSFLSFIYPFQTLTFILKK